MVSALLAALAVAAAADIDAWDDARVCLQEGALPGLLPRLSLQAYRLEAALEAPPR